MLSCLHGQYQTFEYIYGMKNLLQEALYVCDFDILCVKYCYIIMSLIVGNMST